VLAGAQAAGSEYFDGEQGLSLLKINAEYGVKVV